MEIGLVGLGKMGSFMARRLLENGHRVVGYDLSPDRVEAVRQMQGQGANTLAELPSLLASPRVIWIMVPAGEPVSQTIRELQPHLSAGDILIDGGNSNFRDSILRAKELAEDGIEFMDVGVSGGIWGLESGYCMMAGGSEKVFRYVEPVMAALAPKDGYAHVGGYGAGHFVKMIHNGIEYSLLQAYAEGFELMKASEYPLDLHQIASLWNQGSVIRSWLLELAERALQKDPELSRIKGYVEDSGEGRWTAHEAIDASVPIPTIAMSLFMRFRSRQEESFAAKMIAALRHEFGGHALKLEVGADEG